MSKSSKTTTNTVTTPTNPDWVTKSVQGLSGQIGDLSKLDPYSLVPGQNALQTQAASGASGLGVDPAQWSALTGAKTPQVQSQSLLDGLSSYMNPYTNDVVNTTLKGFDQNAGMTRAQQALNEAGSGAFGGSGAAITRSMTEGQLAQQRAATEAGLRDQAFNTGAGLSNLDAGRRQDASSQNANLTMTDQAQKLQALLAGDANNRANVQTQGLLGNDLRTIQQQQAQAPISLLQTQAGLTGSLPYQLFNGQNSNSTSTSKTSDPLGSLGSLALLAAAPFTGGAALAGLGGLGAALGGTVGSMGLGGLVGGGMIGASTGLSGLGAAGFLGSDERLKEDIRTTRHDAKGRRWVSYRYKGTDRRYEGVIAQEVLSTDPHAVRMGSNGFLEVNYGAL